MTTPDLVADARAALAEGRYHVTAVHGTPGQPGCLYTTGLSAHGLPELFMEEFGYEKEPTVEEQEVARKVTRGIFDQIAEWCLSTDSLRPHLVRGRSEFAFHGEFYEAPARIRFINHDGPDKAELVSLMETTRALYPEGFAVSEPRVTFLDAP